MGAYDDLINIALLARFLEKVKELIAGSSPAAPGVVFITDEPDGNGGTIRHIDTDGATITDTQDEHGGTVRSITGTEVNLQIKQVTPTTTEQIIEADKNDGYAALARVVVGAVLPDASKQDLIIASGLLKGDGSGGVTAAVAGTDYQSPLSVITSAEIDSIIGSLQ